MLSSTSPKEAFLACLLSSLESTFLHCGVHPFLSMLRLRTPLSPRCGSRSPDSLPPYHLVLWADGSVPFPLAEAALAHLPTVFSVALRPLFSAGPVCSSFSAEACAILHALWWSQQHQPVCHFSFLLFLSNSRSVLSSIFPFASISLADLTGTVFSLFLF